MKPEQLAKRYFELRDQLYGVRSLNIQGRRGMRFAPNCPKCGRGRTQALEVSPPHCSNCQTKWPMEAVYIPEQRQPGSHEPEPLFDYLDLHKHIQKALDTDLWGTRAFLLYYGEQTGGLRRVAKAGKERWPDAPFRWNKYMAGVLLSRGRRAVKESLA